jgi:plastocyanin
MRIRLLRPAAAALALTALFGACGGDDDDGTTSTTSSAAGTAEHRVILKNIVFTPKEIDIKTGETVTWEWEDGSIAHNVVGDGFSSELVATGTFEHTFDEAGTFEYVCTVHPLMKGKVTVEE